MRSLVTWSLVALATFMFLSCRAARDPDLDRRLQEASEAKAKKAQSPPEASEEAKRTPPAGPMDPPPKGAVDLRSLDEEGIAAIMQAVPGKGERLVAEVVTKKGKITCELDPKGAPQAVANFTSLALGLRPWRDPDTGEVMRNRFYDGLSFHRCIENFVIQTGNPSSVRAGGPGWTIPRETGNPELFNAAGAMAMVDAGDESHGSQFFVTLRASKSLNGRYTPFGSCTGLDLAREIAAAEKHPPKKDGKSATRPLDPVRIERIDVRRAKAVPAKGAPSPAATGESAAPKTPAKPATGKP